MPVIFGLKKTDITLFSRDYNALRDHFRSGHYLCEEGDCQEERFTSVFRTKLDLQGRTSLYLYCIINILTQGRINQVVLNHACKRVRAYE